MTQQLNGIDEGSYVVLDGNIPVHIACYHQVVKAYYKDKWEPAKIAKAAKTTITVILTIIDQEAKNIDYMSRLDLKLNTGYYSLFYLSSETYFAGFDKYGATKLIRKLGALRLDADGCLGVIKKLANKHDLWVLCHADGSVMSYKQFLEFKRLGLLN